MYRTFLSALLGVLVWIPVGAAFTDAAAQSGDVRTLKEGGLGLREKPDRDSRYVVRDMKRGEAVRVQTCEKHHDHHWCRVEYGRYVGWIGQERLARGGAGSDGNSGGGSGGSAGDWEIAGADGDAVLRAKPDRDARAVLQGLRNGDRVSMLGCEKHHDTRWCRVEFNGYIGWIGERRLRQR